MNDIEAASRLTLALCCLYDASDALPTDKHTQDMIATIVAAAKTQRDNLLKRNQIIELPKRKPLGDAA